MKVLGITGGIGCGKSTVIDILKENYQCYIINTDQIAAELMKKDNLAYEKVVEYFGEEILDEDGEINRKKLASRVFKSEMDLLKLNSFTHPLVREEVITQVHQMREMAETEPEKAQELVIIETAFRMKQDLRSIVMKSGMSQHR